MNASRQRSQRQRQSRRQCSCSRDTSDRKPSFSVKWTPKRSDLFQNQKSLSNRVIKLLASYTKLEKMYSSLQSDYGKMRANHTAMAVISKRLQQDLASHEEQLKRLQHDKVNLEAKQQDLETKLASTSEDKEDLKDYGLAKDARIKAIKAAINEVMVDLGPWNKQVLTDSEIDEIFKEVLELL